MYCSLTGYGQTGPRADWPGQDLLIQAMSGIISTTGWEDGPPVTVGTYIADMTGALTAVNAIMMALHASQQYGIGQEISVSLLNAMIAAQSMEATVYLNSGVLPGKSRSGHWQASQPYAIFHTQDRDIAINAHSDDWWLRLCKAPELPISPTTRALPHARPAPSTVMPYSRPCNPFFSPKRATPGLTTSARSTCCAPQSTTMLKSLLTRRSNITPWWSSSSTLRLVPSK